MATGESPILLPFWYDACGISIHELARGRMHLWPEEDLWAWFLNVWARDPTGEPAPWSGMWGAEGDYAGGQCVDPHRPAW